MSWLLLTPPMKNCVLSKLAAYVVLADFSGTPLGKKYPAAMAVRERGVDRFIPFLEFGRGLPCLVEDGMLRNFQHPPGSGKLRPSSHQ